jgi:hypothetical protein
MKNNFFIHTQPYTSTMFYSYFAVHTDDYRAGPGLTLYDDSELKEMAEEEDITVDDVKYNMIVDNMATAEDIEVPVHDDNLTRVYFFRLGVGYYELNLLKTFEDSDNVETYCKQQYTLYTGSPPFISTGHTSAYHPTGNRPPINIPSTVTCDIQHDDNGEDYLYLLIANTEGVVDHHSLNPFAVWE